MDKEIKLRMPQELYARLVGYADKAGISKNQAVREILEFHFLSDDYARVQNEYNQMIHDISRIMEENTSVLASVEQLLEEMRQEA